MNIEHGLGEIHLRNIYLLFNCMSIIGLFRTLWLFIDQSTVINQNLASLFVIFLPLMIYLLWLIILYVYNVLKNT